MMVEHDYFQRLAGAYVRGRLDGTPSRAAHDALFSTPLEMLSHDELATLVRLGLDAGLRLHRFKRTMDLPRVRRVLGILQGMRPTVLLDVGSGRGAFLWPLLDAFPDLPVTALDLLDYRVADVLAVRAGGVVTLSAVRGDATEMPFADSAFDVVTVLEVLEHILDTRRAPAWIVGALFALNTGMIVVLQMPVARRMASWRRTRILATGGVGYGLSFVLFAAPLLSPSLLPAYLCGCIMLYTLAEIMYAPTSTSLAAAMAPIGMQGRYLAVFQLSLASAATITPSLAGAMLAVSPQGLWVLLALLMVGTAALIVVLERGLPEAAIRTAQCGAIAPPTSEAALLKAD